MITTIIEFFRNTFHNDYLTLYVISIIPIIELRGAIVFMSGMFDTLKEMIIGMFCCVAGSTTVILPLLLITRPLIRRMKRTKWFSKLAKNMEANLADRASSAYDEEASEGKLKKKLSSDTKKALGLFAFVAIPLPMTGAWTGSCVGSFLDFPIWKAALSVFFGNIVAGAILTAIAYFLPQQYADFFLYGFVVLAIALAVILYFTRSKRQEKKRAEQIKKYGGKDQYDLELLKQDANEMGQVLIKKEYIDENGDRHIVIGNDNKKNEEIVGKDDVI
ncbi:MAG: small multi-drug export protein [Clostridia bacterium]|nr:small multi-drug export protein [Clostridia bacterium]